VKAEEGLLTVPGATLYYRVRGSGPLLLLLQGGAGNADASEGVAGLLLDRFTVVTYDRRGLSRSRLDEGAVAPSRLRTHSDDAYRLLAALTTEPAFVVGHSIGAVIGLDLVARRPERVRVLVAHEPPAPQFLPDVERAWAERAQLEVEETYHREGAAAAVKEFGAMVHADARNREPDVTPPVQTPQTVADLDFFLKYDAPAARRHRLDIEALATATTEMVFGGGRDSRGVWTRRSAEELAKCLGAEFLEFPGDHNGFTLRPREFAARLLEILNGSAGAAGEQSV
jgi:pimeloyl-ACP methyl ester carboxylesterase